MSPGKSTDQVPTYNEQKTDKTHRFTFGLANAQWIFLNWGQQFSTWRKSLLAVFNWFMFVASAFLTVFGLYTSISALNDRVQDPNDPLNVFTCADNSLF